MERGEPRSGPGGPIVIVGTGRCGSTLLHRLLARHESLGWLSTFNEVFPTQTWLSLLSTLYRAPLPDRLRHAKAFPKPFEAYQFWERFLPGFSRRDRPLTAADVPAWGIEPVRRATASVLRHQRRGRLLVKVTGWSRIAYFDRIYPGVRFVSLRRDPRAVVSSWERADWLDVSSAPESADWQWGEVPAEHLEAWRSLGGGALLSAALKIRLDLDDIARNAELVPGRFHELSYEDLVGSPEPTLRSLCEFCELEWTSRFEGIVRATPFYDSTGTWREHLSEEQGAAVLDFMERTEAAGGQVAKRTARGRVRSKR